MLREVETTEGVHIPWAIESGSRAWGFPSPDSDYDARFIYVRPAAQLLTVWPRRDVIERPIVGDMDVNGWDLSKALRLILKGNAVVIEWLQSPIVYQGQPWLRDALLAFADEWMDRRRVASHYLHLARRQRSRHVDDASLEMPLKKVFYALRPAAALRWLDLHPERTFAPMHFPTLIAECDPPPAIAEMVAELIARKAETRELGIGGVPPALLAFIDDILDTAKTDEEPAQPTAAPAARAADRLFAEATLKLDAGFLASV